MHCLSDTLIGIFIAIAAFDFKKIEAYEMDILHENIGLLLLVGIFLHLQASRTGCKRIGTEKCGLLFKGKEGIFLVISSCYCGVNHNINKTSLHKRMNNIKIRLANKEDAKFIALLGRITFTETFGHFFRDKQDLLNYYNSTFSVEKIENGIAKPNNVFWIAFADRLPVGYAKLKLNSKSEFIDSTNICQLQKIYVLKDFLSMKIGLELQNLLLKKAQELKFKEVWLSVLNSNERAINFYKKSGFEKIGNHDFQIGKENFEFIAMRKEL